MFLKQDRSPSKHGRNFQEKSKALHLKEASRGSREVGFAPPLQLSQGSMTSDLFRFRRGSSQVMID